MSAPAPTLATPIAVAAATPWAATAGSTCGGDTSAITVSDKAVVASQTNCFSAFDLNGVMQEDGGQASNTFASGVRGASFRAATCRRRAGR